MLRKRRHALIGTASALGLLLAPLAGGAVVAAVTAVERPTPGPSQLSAQPPATTVLLPATVAGDLGRRGPAR